MLAWLLSWLVVMIELDLLILLIWMYPLAVGFGWFSKVTVNVILVFMIISFGLIL